MPKGNTKDHSIIKLKGVGPKIAQSLSILGIELIEDAVFHLPYRYEDRTEITKISDAPYELPIVIEGEIIKSTVVFRGRRMLITEIFDGSGRITMRMFNFAFAQHKNLKEGYFIRCFGAIRHGRNGKEMIHPQYSVFSKEEPLAIEKNLTPIYPLTSSLQQGRMRRIIQGALLYCEQKNLLKEKWEKNSENNFDNLLGALAFIHNPPADADIDMLASGQHPAQRKLIKEELVAHILCAGMLKRETEKRRGPSMKVSSSKEKEFIIGTEPNVMHQMKKRNPDKIFIEVPGADGNCSCNRCPYMALNTMEKIYLALKNSKPGIHLSKTLMIKAKKPLKRMLKMTNN